MLYVTEYARQKLKRTLCAKVDDPQVGLRLTARGPGRFTLSIDMEEPGDQVVEHEGSKVLLVERKLAASLDGVTVDIEDTPEGSRIVVFRES
jgi:Fe-S cluster assembly iron-binding protein IscA